ncbi:hypothetical protein [Amycolatopsis sp. NBC_01480]|uniref:hypothetical protein n=1 Tax=Amycolatopsis sp. NBC_01480 TaxID=2903562 RepID=UPI002E2B23BB|nr:hypothetical protein [Amycolatopsis sp. NBC_01480]
MVFRCTLERPSSSLALGSLIGPKVEDDFDSMVAAACGLLAETDCRFHIEGFGALEWPVDVAYDLSAFVEQLPDLIARIRSRSRAELAMDFAISLAEIGSPIAQVHPFSDWVSGNA